MITGCALAAPVICIKTSEQNILFYQYEFIIPEQFNEKGKEAVISEGDMKNIFIFRYCVEQEEKN